MPQEPYIRVQLGGHRRNSPIRGYALIDPEDAAFAAYRWSLGGDGYAVRHQSPSAGRRLPRVKLHRAILGLQRGDPAVDHINGDPLDNRRANLRLATQGENLQNRQGAQRNSRSGVRGVSWHKQRKRWTAEVWIARKKHYLGLFDTIEEANAVASAFRAKHMPYSSKDRSVR